VQISRGEHADIDALIDVKDLFTSTSTFGLDQLGGRHKVHLVNIISWVGGLGGGGRILELGCIFGWARYLLNWIF